MAEEWREGPEESFVVAGRLQYFTNILAGSEESINLDEVRTTDEAIPVSTRVCSSRARVPDW
jgi:hypothetical protein